MAAPLPALSEALLAAGADRTVFTGPKLRIAPPVLGHSVTARFPVASPLAFSVTAKAPELPPWKVNPKFY